MTQVLQEAVVIVQFPLQVCTASEQDSLLPIKVALDLLQ
jgi:hypothetical protein